MSIDEPVRKNDKNIIYTLSTEVQIIDIE